MNLTIDTTEPLYKDDSHKTIGVSMQVFRYNFTESVMDELTTFAKLHEHDTRLDFKDAWKTWMAQNKSLIELETNRLVQAGFTGDVIDKMYKSVRYYFRKKSLVPTVQPPRKTYDSFYKPLLLAIDEQIRSQIHANVIKIKTEVEPIAVSTISPAEGFTHFCDNHPSLIAEAIRNNYNNNNHVESGCESSHPQPIHRDMIVSFMNKLKKTYKNRFYNIKVSLSKIVAK